MGFYETGYHKAVHLCEREINESCFSFLTTDSLADYLWKTAKVLSDSMEMIWTLYKQVWHIDILWSEQFNCFTSCKFRIVTLLKGQFLPQYQTLGRLKQVFFHDCSVFSNSLPNILFPLKESMSIPMLCQPCIILGMLCSGSWVVLVLYNKKDESCRP